MTLVDKTISGLTWSFIDNFLNNGLTFIIGIILARLLEPKEFGLIGMIMIFIAVAQSFVDSGFSQALIRKKDCTEKDYNTVFYFNILVSVIFYIILFFSAGLISSFFNQVELINIIKVMGLSVILNGFGIVQGAQLTKEIDIKTQTKISAIANTASGLLSIYLAYIGFGVWSLVWRSMSNNLIRIILLWMWHKWRPKLIFSIQSFKELFGFGSKLLASGLLNTIFENLYYLVIGKYFSAQQLGYYTRALTFASLPSLNINGVVQRVSYPVLSKLQDDNKLLQTGFKKLIKNTMFITFILMMIMAAVAKPLILTLIGQKWIQAVIYLQLLCFSLMLYPLHSLNLNVLNVKGRSDLFLKLEIIKKILVIPVILVGIIWGIIPMILGMIIHSFICYFLNSRYAGLMIDYSVIEQIKDITPGFILAGTVAIIIFIPSLFINTIPIILLTGQLLLAALLVLTISEMTKLEPYLEIKEIVLEKFLRR
uniref:Lipopolysaccharide biosynthesis protein n=1 Tax=Ignavibacterium album TaxID=591197 RepID=A0A832DIT1_9BACT